MRYVPLRCLICTLTLLAFAAAARAEGEGQADLDRATELKLSAESLEDLDQVISLCESALEKGLDDQNRTFAKQLLTSTLYQHARQLCAPIFDAKQPHPRWQVLRQFAVRDLEKALTHDADLGDVHLLLAKLMLLPGGNAQRAVASINQAVENLKENRDQYAEALILRAKLTGEAEQRLADLTKALEVSPGNLDALRTRGMVYLAAGQAEKALADLEQVLEKAPEDVTSWEAAAQLLAGLEKFDEALEHVNQAIEQNPENAPIYVVRARIYAMQENDEKALADLNKALQLDPEHLAALLMRARVYQVQQQLEKAKADIDAALKLRPDLTQALLLQSLNAAAAGQMGEAIVSLRRVLAIDPKNAQLRQQLAAYYVVDRRPRAAIEVYNALLEEDPQNAMALRGRGDAYLSVGKHEQAVADLSAALKLKPDDAGILNNLSWVLSTSPNDSVRNGARALELAKKACEASDYKQPHILSTLAAAHAELGDFEEARNWSQKALEMSNDEEMKKQLRDELEHFRQQKPFRELQETEENQQPLKYGPGEFEL